MKICLHEILKIMLIKRLFNLRLDQIQQVDNLTNSYNYIVPIEKVLKPIKNQLLIGRARTWLNSPKSSLTHRALESECLDPRVIFALHVSRNQYRSAQNERFIFTPDSLKFVLYGL